jgi:starvation-inducible outer membrane lipoprotein
MVLVCWEQGSIFCICTVAVELSACTIVPPEVTVDKNFSRILDDCSVLGAR